mgnify:CR=1 FL=1
MAIISVLIHSLLNKSVNEFFFFQIVVYSASSGISFTKLVSRSSGVTTTNETQINLVLDLFEIRNISYNKVYTISALTGGLTKAWGGKIYVGDPSDGCGLNNVAFDPDLSVLMLEFWGDGIYSPEYSTRKCSLPLGAIDARGKGWQVSFQIPYFKVLQANPLLLRRDHGSNSNNILHYRI